METISWSRAEPKTLLPAALAMYAQGKTRSQVLQAIYGVDLPREALVCFQKFAHGDEGLAVDWRYHPWELMIPPGEGKRAPYPINDYQSNEDALAYELAPNVLLLGDLHYFADGVRLGGSLFGYDLDELRAGRTTVVGLLRKCIISRNDQFTVLGPSIVDILVETVSSYLAFSERLAEMDNHEDPDPIRKHLKRVEALQRELKGP
jgi:hypothetical protein